MLAWRHVHQAQSHHITTTDGTTLTTKPNPTTQSRKMKLSTILAVTLAVVAPAAVDAANCKTGLHYCGYVLLRKGNYYNQIIEALKKADKSTSSAYVNHSLFYCTGGSNGNIKYQAKCSSCVDGGDGKSDHC
ncbi:hypothetical protein QC763_106440 [Podospora pseudopauciseta]|uniref:Uncharacterized protein n=1 Tax=Podospora pseudopauciseta TaxID=2093780 RepID=A0ABR0HXL9_9PEZI|nr:hypothetical protein QC763_106440 [Podospora pseudopauciseta]